MEWWTEFYVAGFKSELKKFREIVESGETNPYRAINLFQLWEHGHQRVYDPETGNLWGL